MKKLYTFWSDKDTMDIFHHICRKANTTASKRLRELIQISIDESLKNNDL